MSLYTVRPVLRTDKPNKQGNCPIAICVTINRKRRYHSVGISVLPAQWDAAKGRVKPSVQNAASYNVRIGNEMGKLEKELLAASDKGDLSHATTKVAAKKKVDFYQYAEDVFLQMDSLKQHVTARRYRNDIPSIREYAGTTLSISEINKEWLKGYENFCRKGYKNPRRKEQVSISQNTIWSRFKMLRKILLKAAADELIPVCPLGEKRNGYPMPTWEKVPKDYLTLEEVDRLFDLLGAEGLTKHDDLVLSYFLVECTAGIRHSDWSRFSTEKLIDGKALKVRTKKTGEPVYVPIGKGTRLEKVLKHIQKQKYNYTDTESGSANRTLKIIAKVAGISKPVTTHTGRHTAATLYLEKGFSREAVAEILGVTMKVIDTYAKMTRLKVRNEFEKLGGL